MLKNKNILIISRQKWGKMFLSKHNYALELSAHNNVYFLESPDKKFSNDISLVNCPDSKSIKIIKNKVTYLYRYKYLGKTILKFLINKKVKSILSVINCQLDLVISFDDYGLYPFLEQFKAKKYVFFPVDAAASPLVNFTTYPNPYLFSISEEVAEKYAFLKKEVIILNHGVSKYWQEIAKQNIQTDYQPNKQLKFGYTGNLLKGKIQDTETLKKVITKFNDVEFHFWGPYEKDQSNVGAKIKDDINDWVSFLLNKPNVFLHGVLHPKELVNSVNKMDGFFICKNDAFDHNKSSNSHKIMEYLSTGKVVVSSHLSSYLSLPKFIAMPPTPSNSEYVNIFEDVITNINIYNSKELINARINFVLENTYSKNIDRIIKILNS